MSIRDFLCVIRVKLLGLSSGGSLLVEELNQVDVSSVNSPPGANTVDDAGQNSMTQTADATGIDAPAGQEAGNTGAEQSASKEGQIGRASCRERV